MVYVLSILWQSCVLLASFGLITGSSQMEVSDGHGGEEMEVRTYANMQSVKRTKEFTLMGKQGKI